VCRWIWQEEHKEAREEGGRRYKDLIRKPSGNLGHAWAPEGGNWHADPHQWLSAGRLSVDDVVAAVDVEDLAGHQAGGVQ
jgi:hypothetical protein